MLDALVPVCTRPTFRRFVTLFGSTILTTGRRTVANNRRTAAPMAQGHVTTYQRVLTSADWSTLRLALQLYRLVSALIPADQAVVLVGESPVDGYPDGRSTPRPGTGTRSAPTTATPPGGMVTTGSSWRS